MAPTLESNQCEVVLIGCGAPLRGMGWYHAKQLLLGECASAKLSYVVEPWFMGGGKSRSTYHHDFEWSSTVAHDIMPPS